jgi:hypothetical protein
MLGEMPDPVATEKQQKASEEKKALTLDEENWETLLTNMEAKRCTPFLGAGASTPPLPKAKDLALMWAKQYNYPLENQTDLASVTQYLRIKFGDPFVVKQKIKTHFKSFAPPDFSGKAQIHALLADLGLPIYLTTNYDDYMEQALKRIHRRPVSEICRWNTWIRNHCGSIFDKKANPGFELNEEEPVVFHLHGLIDYPESLVLTEDDYVDFLVSMGEQLIPEGVQGALAEKSVLFLGYGLADWNFRVLFRTVARYLERSLIPVHVSVQLLPPPPEKEAAVLDYLNKYFGELKIRVFWGTCQQFAAELGERRQKLQEKAAAVP